jgi:hypothetical protein
MIPKERKSIQDSRKPVTEPLTPAEKKLIAVYMERPLKGIFIFLRKKILKFFLQQVDGETKI